MDSFTPSELSTMRMPTQAFTPKLAVFKPAIVWQGTVAGNPAKGARTISVSTVSGSLLNIINNTTMVIDPGINELRIRIRSTAGSTITFEENSIDWQNGLQLRALLLFDPRSVRGRIVQNGTTVTYYEDYDIPYTDQNETFSPVVNIGPAAFALEKDSQVSGTYADLELDASESFCFDSSISSYQWGILYGDADPFDAEIIGSSTSVTAQFRFWDTGDYYIYCTITAANGKSRTGYRPVTVRNSRSGYADSPFFQFNANLSGSRDSGYWSAQITLFEDCDEDKFPRGVPIIIYGNVVYSDGASRNTNSIPWHYSSTAHQRFVGWVSQESWTQDFMTKGVPVSFDAAGLLGLMDERPNYPGWLQYSTNPAEWTDMKSLSSDRMIYFYLSNRTTLLNITDWHPSNTSRLTRYSTIADGQVFSSMKEYLADAEIVEICSDRCGAIWCEFDGNALNDYNRATIVTDIFTLTPDDRMNNVHIPTTRDIPEVAWLSIDGLYFDGNADVPRIAWAPGYVYAQNGGGIEEQSGLIIDSQANLNELCGRLYSVKNNPFKSIELESNGVWPYDIAPQASIHYDEMVSGTFREETIDGLDLLIRDVSDKFYVNGSGLNSSLKLEAIIRDHDANVGSNIPKAASSVEGIFPPEITGPDPGDFSNDWGSSLFDWPSFDNTIPDTLSTPITLANSAALYAWTPGNIGRLRKGSVNWEKLLTAAQLYPTAVDPRIKYVRLHPWDPKNKAIVALTDGGLTKPLIVQLDALDSASPTITEILTNADLIALTGGSSFAFGSAANEIDLSININGFIAVHFMELTALGSTYVYRFSDSSPWQYSNVFAPSGVGPVSFVMGHHTPSTSSGRVYAEVVQGAGFLTYIYISTDNGATWSVDYNYGFANFTPNAAYMDMPYADNLNDYLLYAVAQVVNNPNSVVRRNSDGSYTDIAPLHNGNYYGNGQILSYTYNRSQVMLIGTDGTFVYLFYSLDAGDNWSISDNPTAAGAPSWMGGWPYDRETLFVISRDAVPKLMYTENILSGNPGNVIWNDVTNDFYTVVDTINDAIGMVPVWVE